MQFIVEAFNDRQGAHIRPQRWEVGTVEELAERIESETGWHQEDSALVAREVAEGYSLDHEDAGTGRIVAAWRVEPALVGRRS